MAIDLSELAASIGQLTLRFRLRRFTAAQWTANNEVLLDAEEGYERDTGKFKIGDGSTPWNSLPYSNSGVVESVVAGTGIDVDSTDPANPIVSVIAGGAYPLPPGCIAWFDAKSRDGVSGKPVNFLSSATAYPGMGTMALQLNAPNFAADGGVASGKFSVSPAVLLTDCTILAVIKTPASLTSGQVSTIFSGNTAGALAFRFDESGGVWALRLVKSSIANIGSDGGAGSLAASTVMLVGATMSGSNWSLRRGGTQTTSGTTSDTPTAVSDRIGTDSSPGADAVHELFELLVFDRALGSTDMATAENYLKTRYGL